MRLGQRSQIMTVDNEESIKVEVLEDELLYELPGLRHLLFGSAHRNTIFFRDGLIGLALTEGQIHILSCGGKPVNRGLQDLLVLPVLYTVVRIVDSFVGPTSEKPR